MICFVTGKLPSVIEIVRQAVANELFAFGFRSIALRLCCAISASEEHAADYVRLSMCLTIGSTGYENEIALNACFVQTFMRIAR